MAAEYALRTHLAQQSPYLVQSAGFDANSKTIQPVISNRLIRNGINPSAHIPQLLTKKLVKKNDLIIAMGLGHREFIQERFGLKVPLFNQV